MNIRSIVPAPLLHLAASMLSVRRKIVFEATLDSVADTAAKVPVTYRWGCDADVARLTERVHDYAHPAKGFGHERLAAGDRLVLGELQGQVIYYGWLMFGQLDMGTRRYVRLPADTAYSYRLFTVTEQRRKGLLGAYYSYVAKSLRPLGIRRVLSWVEARNKPSILGHEALGFRRIGSIWHVRFLFGTFFVLPPSTRSRLRGGQSQQSVAGRHAAVAAQVPHD